MTINKKIILGTLGTIFIGGIGSGVWEYILKPLFNISSEFVLNLISFGIQNFKDQIYLEIAKNFHEDASISILKYTTTILLLLFIMTNLFILIKKHFKKYIKTKVINENNNRKNFYYIMFICFYIIFATSFFQVFIMRIQYINKSITNYNHLLTITSPYIEKSDKILIESKFALIKNKKNYESVIQRLKSIAEKNSIDISHLKIK